MARGSPELIPRQGSRAIHLEPICSNSCPRRKSVPFFLSRQFDKLVRSKLPNIRIRSGFLGAIIFGSAIAAIDAVGRGLAAGEKRSCVMKLSEVKVGMCVLIHGLERRTELNDRWGEVLQKVDILIYGLEDEVYGPEFTDPERFLVKVFDPDLGFGRGDWSSETVRLKAENLKESLIGPTNHEGMPCGASNPRGGPGGCDNEKLVASQILHDRDEDMLTWQEIKDEWGNCVNFAYLHGFDPQDWDTFDEFSEGLRELSKVIKARSQSRVTNRTTYCITNSPTWPRGPGLLMEVPGGTNLSRQSADQRNEANGAAPAAAVENEIKAFIGGLASWVTDKRLKFKFEKYGIVGAKVKRYNGRSRGFGFVSFETEEGRQKAVDELHGKDSWGRQITVTPAKPRDPNAPRPRRGRGTKHSRGRGADQGTEATNMPYKGTNSQGNSECRRRSPRLRPSESPLLATRMPR